MNNVHRPFHLYDGHTYFLTGRCYKGTDYFYNDERKEMFQKVLKESIERFDIKLFSWVLLDNHYHILFSIYVPDEFLSVQFVNPNKDEISKSKSCYSNKNYPNKDERNDEMSSNEFRQTLQKKKIIEFVRKLHKDTARFINKIDKTPGRQIWYQYFDYCLRNKADFWKHFNYIIKNPFKHGLVKSLEEAFHYKYSSNPVWLKRFGVEGINESFIKYSVEEVFLKD